MVTGVTAFRFLSSPVAVVALLLAGGGKPAGASPHLWGDTDGDVDALKLLRFVAALPYTQDEPCPDIGEEVLVSAGVSRAGRAV
ncbi:MAG: hypothetical protein HYY03_09195 [Chloroflexi bacterium]|nr:hypothetical protein [Chloroflexota bacterium]